jgi:FkbM family methyltransferase
MARLLARANVSRHNMLRSAIRQYTARSRIALPVLLGPGRGGRVRLKHTGPRNFVPYVLGRYEHDTVRFLRESLRTGRVFADIGALSGFYTRVALSELPRGGIVVAFEPHPVGRGHVQELSGRADGKQLIVREEPLGATDTEGKFTFGRGSGYATAREGLPVRDGEERTVQFRSLDSLIAEGAFPAPDVVKVDVEGLEAEALAGMRQLLTTVPPTLAIECHTLRLLSDTLSVLDDVGYRNVIVARKRPHAGPWQVLTRADWAS